MIYQFIKNWVMSIVLMIIFLVIIDMVVPSNNFKKYVKFVAGLMVIIVILTPVFKIFAKNINIDGYISKYYSAFESTQKSSIQNNNLKTQYYEQISDKYKDNLKNKIESEILNKTKKNYTVKDIKINSSVSDKNFGQIEEIQIAENNTGTVKQVDKIIIGKENNEKKAISQKDKEAMNVLSNEFGIDPSIVKILK